MNSDILLKRLCVSLAKLIAILINIILEYAEMLVLIGGTIRLLKISCLYRTYSIMDSLQLLFLYYLWIFLRVLGKNNGVVSFSIFYSLLFTIFFHLDEIEPKIWDPSLPYHLTQGWVGKWIHNNPKRIKSNANSCNKKKHRSHYRKIRWKWEFLNYLDVESGATNILNRWTFSLFSIIFFGHAAKFVYFFFQMTPNSFWLTTHYRIHES